MTGGGPTHAAGGRPYRGRLAPSPTGLLHLGHARTFAIAHARARAAGGRLILRNEDLDPHRSRREFLEACIEDLRWLGVDWDEGPDVGGPHAPYDQSARLPDHRRALAGLHRAGWIYPCHCSRQDVARAAGAPHAGDDEPVYPGTCRPDRGTASPPASRPPNWRFRVPDGEALRFVDGHFGPQSLVAGVDFGDFVVWRHDDVPAYQLAVVVDDIAMGITEVVRGEDLLRSTARQLLLYRALGAEAPAFYHCPLVRDESGQRLAKRHASLSLAALRAAGADPRSLLATTLAPGAASPGAGT